MTRDPNRRVRFALEGYPSPVSTSSTLSSPGPRTPQQLTQPLVHVYQPSLTSTSSPFISSISPNQSALAIPCDIHDVLGNATFDFDVSLDPASNPALRDNLFLQRVRNEPATVPPVPSLTLVSRDLPWEVIITSSSVPFVTISDVLGGLYRALRIPVREEEFSRESAEKQNAISTAYYQRFERHVSDRQLREQEKQKGVKRIDFLAGSHRFKGLSKTERPNVWIIKLKR
ncbi:hypothetical protein AN958_12295 [Leucoagaricus sp. SymC.cos]|nr:hypothetical protein AN958_12295 [Leucoagaricus sp. SymC.cos]